MAVVIKGSGSIEGSSGLEMGANGTTEIRGKVNVALGSSVAGDSYTSGISTASNFAPSSVPTSERNIIINGAMQVAQRGTSAAATINYATVDRFSIVQSGGQNSPDQAQSALSSSDSGPWADGLRYSYKMTNGAQSSADANDYSLIVYKVESQDMAQSGWDYGNTSSDITLSFWVRTSIAETYYFDLVTQDTTSQGYCMSAALSANTWTKIERTIPGASGIVFNSDNGSGLEINWNLYYGSDYTDAGRALNTWAAWASGTRTPVNDSSWWLTDNATFEITGVQLEVGSVATPFEHRSKATELLRCQRYLQVLTSGDDDNYFGTGYYYNSSNAYLQYRMQPEMRSGPSVVQVTGTNYYYLYRDGSGDGFDGFTGFQWNSGTANAGRSGAFYNNTAMSGTGGQTGGFYASSNNAKISLDAEL